MPVKAVVIGYIIFVIIVVVLYFNWQAASTSKDSTITPIVLEKGQGVKEIGEKLKEMGLIKNDKLFQGLVWLMNLRKNFWPGTYELKPNMDLLEIVRVLTSRKGPEEKTITIVEGWTANEIANYLDQNGIVSKGNFLATLKDKSKFINEYDFLKNLPESATLEGFLFPDTYRIYKETTADAVIRKMLNNFETKVTPEMRAEASKHNRTLFQVITLASLVEKEAADDTERKKVADVFWRRIDNNIPLQSCASINYILGVSKRQLSFQETRTPSLYNTYLNKGLSPGPINNPGLSSIKAVIYPLKNDYWFFLSTPEGKTIFSRTKDEHDRNKALYLK